MGCVFYPDRLHEVFEEASTVPEKEQPEAVRQTQIALQTFFKKLNRSQSEPYYVILQADGDRLLVLFAPELEPTFTATSIHSLRSPPSRLGCVARCSWL